MKDIDYLRKPYDVGPRAVVTPTSEVYKTRTEVPREAPRMQLVNIGTGPDGRELLDG